MSNAARMAVRCSLIGGVFASIALAQPQTPPRAPQKSPAATTVKKPSPAKRAPAPASSSAKRAPAAATAAAKGKPAKASVSAKPTLKAKGATAVIFTWDRAAWVIETGLRPVEVDRLRRSRCIPGTLTPATEARLRRAFDRWKLTSVEKTNRIAAWTCGTGAGVAGKSVPSIAIRSPAASGTRSQLGVPTASMRGAPDRAPAVMDSTGLPSAGIPVAPELRREQVELDLAPVLPMIPARPVYPVRPVLRELRTDAWWSLAAGGVASLASAVFCRHRATAPEPYGGTYWGRYHVAGTFVASAFLVCTSSMLLSTAVLTLPVLRTQAHMQHRSALHGFAVDTARHSESQRAYQDALRIRAAKVDSAWAARKAQRSSGGGAEAPADAVTDTVRAPNRQTAPSPAIDRAPTAPSPHA